MPQEHGNEIHEYVGFILVRPIRNVRLAQL